MGFPVVDDVTSDELMAVVLARRLRNGWRGVAPFSPVMAAACLLAQSRHAPDLSFSCGTFGVNPPFRLYPTGTDPRYLVGAEAINDMYDVFEYSEVGVDFMFYGGIQIDRHGNANNVRVGGPGTGRPLRQGTGQANASHPVTDGRFFLVAPRHTPDVFVEQVDYVSVVGFLDGPGAREKVGITGGGPELCVSELAVMDFDPGTRTMRLLSVHRGRTAGEVRARTGFDLPNAGPISETRGPDADELAALRALDPDGILRSVAS